MEVMPVRAKHKGRKNHQAIAVAVWGRVRFVKEGGGRWVCRASETAALGVAEKLRGQKSPTLPGHNDRLE